MFEITETHEGFRITCNDYQLIDAIPSKDIASQMVEKLKTLGLDWSKFDGSVWLDEKILIGLTLRSFWEQNQ